MAFDSTKMNLEFRGDKFNPAIVFVHGFPFDKNMWDKATAELCRNFYCVLYNVRGLGHSNYDDLQFTMETLADDLIELVEHSEISQPYLCGLSMGGYISLRAFEKRENLFSGLILCDSRSGADKDEAKLNRAAGVKKINEIGLKQFVIDFMPQCFSEDFIYYKKHIYDEIIYQSSTFNPVGVKACLIAMAGRTDTTKVLDYTQKPVHFIVGENDKFTPPDIMESLSSIVSNSTFNVIKNAAHVPPVENTAEFVKIINHLLFDKQ